ncbi:hypothetical protein GCM10017673_12290 [Streptosporangium violaceochromogenes]|nr:hypothetical protein GCM10017673_12290 [Streptosporangium violaceochromogenes]
MRFIPSLPRRSATAVHVTLGAQVLAIAALTVFERVRGRRLAREISALGGDPHAPGAHAVVGAVTVFALLMMIVAVTVIASVTAYLTWLIRARRNAAHPEAPAWPVLVAWLVPGVNLVAPPLLLYRLWWSSRPPAGRHDRWVTLLTVWWLSWLTTLALVLVRLPLDTAPQDADLTGLGPIELVSVALSALLCAATVREIAGVQAAGARQGRGAGAHRMAPRAVREILTRRAMTTLPGLPASPVPSVLPGLPVLPVSLEADGDRPPAGTVSPTTP